MVIPRVFAPADFRILQMLFAPIVGIELNPQTRRIGLVTLGNAPALAITIANHIGRCRGGRDGAGRQHTGKRNQLKHWASHERSPCLVLTAETKPQFLCSWAAEPTLIAKARALS